MCLNVEVGVIVIGCGGIWVLNQELRVFQIVNIINYVVNKILQIYRVDDQGYVVFVDGGVIVIYFFIECEVVLKIGVIIICNVNVQFQIWIFFFFYQFFDFVGCCV